MSAPIIPPHVVIADHFADDAGGTRRLRLEMVSGEQFTCREPRFDYDKLALCVMLKGGVVRELQPSQIRSLFERRANWTTRLTLGIATFMGGIAVGAVAQRSSTSPWVFVGGLAGAFAAPLLVWLLQDVPPFVRWNRVFPRVDA